MQEMEHQGQKDLYARVSTYLQQAFGEQASPRKEGVPLFIVDVGYPIGVEIAPIGEDNALANFFAFVGDGISITDEVCRFLVERNANLWFGAFNSTEDLTRIDYALPDIAVSKDAVSLTVRYLADIARVVDNELTMKFR